MVLERCFIILPRLDIALLFLKFILSINSFLPKTFIVLLTQRSALGEKSQAHVSIFKKQKQMPNMQMYCILPLIGYNFLSQIFMF